MERKMQAKAEKPRKKQAISKEHRYWFLHEIPFFGIKHPSIDEAAELIVVDMVFSGYYAKKVPKKFEGNPKNPKLLKALSKEIEEFKDRLVSAVEKGQLKADPVKMDFDDNLITGACHIRLSDIIDWLSKRGYQVGDVFREYSENEFKVLDRVCNEITYMRTVQHCSAEAEKFNLIQSIEKDPKLKNPKITELIRLYALARAKNIISEVNKRYREPTLVDAPITTRAKRTMLTIIAALCQRAKIDYEGIGAARHIKEATEELGARVDDETIRQLLKEIEDAVESRMRDSDDRRTNK
jgi:hypothetical protein